MVELRPGKGVSYSVEQEYPGKTIAEINRAAKALRGHISAQRPDFIAVGGRSAGVSQSILEGRVHFQRHLLVSPELLVFPDGLNQSLYSSYGPFRSSEEVGEQLRLRFPQLRRNSRLLVIDDFAETGDKARRTLGTFAELGFENVNYAVIAADPENADALVASGIFVASKDPDAYQFINRTALTVSRLQFQATNGGTSEIKRRIAQRDLDQILSNLRRLSG